VATVDCVNCGRYADDMDGACQHCGMSIFEQVAETFNNGAWKPKKDLSVSSSGRMTEDEQWRILAALDEPLTGARQRSLPRQGPPLRPVNTTPREDYGWLDNLTRAVADAQEVYEQTRADWEKADLRGLVAQERILMHHQDERALRPDERHEYVMAQADIAFRTACYEAMTRARDRYFRLLDEFSEVEKSDLGLRSRRGFEDPADPYRDTSRDDGSLAWLEKRAERDRKDRRYDGGARGFSLG
jgi:hypothetical protein